MNTHRFIRYTSRFFVKKGLPLNLIFFVTSKCNARCQHCFFWREINNSADQLTLSEIEKIAKSVPSLMSVSLTGGEPFLRDDLAEIALIFSRYTRAANLQIPSNGLLTDQIVNTARKIVERCRKDMRIIVGVSLDDFGEKHDQIRQVSGLWQKALATIGQLKEIESEFPNFLVASTITITKNNQERVRDLSEYLKNELKVKEVGVNLIRSDVKDMSLKELEIKYYDDINTRLRKDFLEKNRMRPRPSMVERILSARQNLGAQLLSEIFTKKRDITPCYAGNLLAILRENGDIYPCEMLDLKMGNVKDFNFDFKKLWFSQKASEARRQIKKMKCFCTYECAMTLNTLFNIRHLSVIIKKVFVER